jgi:hypothetical protein
LLPGSTFLPVYSLTLIQKRETMTYLYEIRISGQLDDQWTDWFEGMSITLQEDGTALLSGPVPDQSALYGLLRKVRDLGLPLIAVNRTTVALNPQSTTQEGATKE